MSGFKYVLLVAAVAAVIPRGGARSVDLSDAMNKTVCAIKVHYDVQEHRIPKRIKMLKCETETDLACKANDISDDYCCHKKGDMQCVEMKDLVQVKNTHTMKSQVIEVSVGCACMIQRPSQGLDLKDGLAR